MAAVAAATDVPFDLDRWLLALDARGPTLAAILRANYFQDADELAQLNEDMVRAMGIDAQLGAKLVAQAVLLPHKAQHRRRASLTEWTCRDCTFANAVSDTACAMCSNRRSRGSSPSLPPLAAANGFALTASSAPSTMSSAESFFSSLPAQVPLASTPALVVTEYKIVHFPDGSKAEGEHRGGQPNGKCVVILPNFVRTPFAHCSFDSARTHTYSGIFGIFVCVSRCVCPDNQVRYDGVYQIDPTTMLGSFTTKEKTQFQGAFKDSKPCGTGVMTWADGQIYDGQWLAGKKHGVGAFTWANGDKYVGSYMYDKQHGDGVFTWAQGGKYDGQWREGNRYGLGTHTWADGTAYTGEWVLDKRSGRGTMSHISGQPAQSGLWLNNKFQG